MTKPTNTIGYAYLGQNDHQLAITLFQFNVDQFPDSSNTHDSLAEAYLQANDKAKAKIHYRKALELDPDNERIKEILEGM